MKIILIHPQIPQNTGNIVRTCAVTGSSLCLVKPLGFSVHDRWLKRAGLDYWEDVPVEILEEDEFLEQLEQASNAFYFFSSKTTSLYTEKNYKSDDWLIFGSETKGLPPVYHEHWSDHFVKIPMKEGVRCLNLATSVGIAVYEGLRQQSFHSMSL